MKNSAILIELFNNESILIKRRITFSNFNAMDWIEQFAKQNNATVTEVFSDEGFIDNGIDKIWNYELTDIAIV